MTSKKSDNSSFFITGTSSGIGKALAESLRVKHRVIGCGRSENTIGGIEYFQGNLQEEAFLENLASHISSIDYLILNAGVGYFGDFHEIGGNKHRQIIETNLLSPILLTQRFLSQHKIKQGIIAIGSIAGKKSLAHGASYAASKFGLRGFMMQLKNEYKKLGIHLINPSIVDTDFHTKGITTPISRGKSPIPSSAGGGGLNFSKFKQTNLDDIIEVVQNIVSGEEKRFEIDV